MKFNIPILALIFAVTIPLLAEGVYYYKCDECGRGIFDPNDKDHLRTCSQYPINGQIKINFSPNDKHELLESVESIIRNKHDLGNATDDEIAKLLITTFENYRVNSSHKFKVGQDVFVNDIVGKITAIDKNTYWVEYTDKSGNLKESAFHVSKLREVVE